MTVSRHRRRVSTSVALGASIAGFALAIGLGIVGGVAIYHTSDGEVQGSQAPEDHFPDTPTGLITVFDDAGALASAAVVVVRPASGGDEPAGGSLVPIPVTADVSGGFGDARIPLDSVEADAVAGEVTTLLGLTVDADLALDESALAELLAPLGPLTIDVPADVTDADGNVTVAAGPQTLDPSQVAALLAAPTADTPSVDDYDLDVAAWRAIAAAIGDGLDAPLGTRRAAPAGTAPAPAPDLANELWWATSGPLRVARLHAVPVNDLAANPDGVDVLSLDRAEVVTLFAHVAPTRLAAPNPGYNLRVVSPFADDQLPAGLTRYDVAYAATATLLGLDTNVVSVDTTAGDTGAATVVEVADDALVAAAEGLSAEFGTVEVRVADRRIAGIDAVVTLGTDFLDRVLATSVQRGAAVVPSGPAGSGPVDQTATVPGTSS